MSRSNNDRRRPDGAACLLRSALATAWPAFIHRGNRLVLDWPSGFQPDDRRPSALRISHNCERSAGPGVQRCAAE